MSPWFSPQRHRDTEKTAKIELDENLKETGKELDDIKLKLDAIHDLPSGAGPINFIKDFDGIKPTRIHTEARVTLDKVGDAFSITIHLNAKLLNAG